MIYEVTKSVVSVSIGLGAAKVVEHAIKATTPVGITKVGKVLVYLGSFGIGGLVSSAVAQDIDLQITKFENVVREIKSAREIKKSQKKAMQEENA